MHNNYRSIAGPMCGNCKHSECTTRKNPVAKAEWAVLTCKIKSPYLGGISQTSESHWCCLHEFNKASMKYFDDVCDGALPQIEMIPKPLPDGHCDYLCVYYGDGSCHVDDEPRKPIKGCPQFGRKRK